MVLFIPYCHDKHTIYVVITIIFASMIDIIHNDKSRYIFYHNIPQFIICYHSLPHVSTYYRNLPQFIMVIYINYFIITSNHENKMFLPHIITVYHNSTQFTAVKCSVFL